MNALLRFCRLSVLAFACFASAALHADEEIYTKVDTPPVPVRTPPPKYPPDLRREGVSGACSVTIVIDTQGAVIDAEVAKASHEGFKQPSLDAIKQWKFKPAQKDGKTVKVRVTVPLVFNYEE
ncbi:MAG TPA: energy transducer TonB [Opitutaceae bacterium]